MNNNYFIIGSSAAGFAAIKNIRQSDNQAIINLICKEELPTTNKCFWADYALGLKTQTDINLFSIEMLDALRINIIKASINKLDTKNKIIYDTLNNSYSYDKLIIACGLTSKKITNSNFYNLNSFENVQRLLNKLESFYLNKILIDKIVIMGAGLTGLEFSDIAKKYAKQVILLDKSATPLSNMISNDAGNFLIKQLEISGITFIGNSSEIPEADIYINATGAIPQEWLKTLENQNGYIITNNYMQTSDSSIWAAGDCILAPDKRNGIMIPSTLWPDAIQQGTIAGLASCGLTHKSYNGFLPICSSSFAGVRFAAVSHINLIDQNNFEIIIENDNKDYTELYLLNNKLVAYTLIGKCSKSAFLKRILLTGEEFNYSGNY